MTLLVAKNYRSGVPVHCWPECSHLAEVSVSVWRYHEGGFWSRVSVWLPEHDEWWTRDRERLNAWQAHRVLDQETEWMSRLGLLLRRDVINDPRWRIN